jgi:hypothetical protein
MSFRSDQLNAGPASACGGINNYNAGESSKEKFRK